MEDFNKNSKQVFFNEIKGTITEINNTQPNSSITLSVGHENTRDANLVCKADYFEKHTTGIKVGDKILIRFYIASWKSTKSGRWHTTATILNVLKQ